MAEQTSENKIAEEQEEKPELLWKPKTELGKKVKSGEIADLNQLFEKGYKIREPEIIDYFLPNIKTEFVMIGQAKGKFGGGKRRIIRQTQKKTAEGNKPKFSALAIVGNCDGYVGIGVGKAKESVPAKEKAVRSAKLNMIKVVRGCGSWKCACGEEHSLPFATEGRCGSVRVELLPAPRGVGLVADHDVQKLLRLAGYKDVWSRTKGQTRKKINLIYACFEALKKASKMRT